MSNPFFALRADPTEEKKAGKAMKKGCTKWLILLIALTIIYSWWFNNPVVGGIFGFLMLVAIGFLSTPFRKREELALVRQAGYSPFRPDTTIFQDGKRVALFGYIYPLHGSGMKAPFSHKDCVAYSYSIQSGTGEDSYKKYEGFRIVPSVIMTRRGDVKLFAYPELKGFVATPKSEMSYQNALDYIRAATFETFKVSEIRKAYESIIKELMDNSGDIRKDTKFNRTEETKDVETAAFRLTENQPELSPDDTLEEICVGIRDEVCLLGTWSSARQGIISDYAETVKRVTLTKGNQQQVLESIRKTMIVYPLIGVVIAAIVNLLAWYLPIR
jgi:phosphate/sulfate permease